MSDLRNHISFTPFGRGNAASDTYISGPYADLQTLLNTTKLDYTNLSPRAGWLESAITFSTTTGHNHAYSRIAENAISTRQFNRVKHISLPGCGRVFTTMPGMLVLFGRSSSQGFTAGGLVSEDITVDFLRDGLTGETFLPGTVPMVFVSPGLAGHPTTGTTVQVVVTSVNSFGCTLNATKVNTGLFGRTDGVLYVYWMAIGVAPGLVAKQAIGSVPV